MMMVEVVVVTAVIVTATNLGADNTASTVPSTLHTSSYLILIIILDVDAVFSVILQKRKSLGEVK